MKNQLTKKLLVPFFLCLTILATISIGSVFYIQTNHALKVAEETFTKTIRIFEKKFETDIQIYQTFIKFISRDKEAIKLYQSGNREGLYQYYKGPFNELKKQYNISHFYFHKNSKINFLRVHNPKKHSDTINRNTLNKSITKKGLGEGIEFGITHNLTLRVVYPWFVEGEIIGYIELGKEIDYFTPELSKLTQSEIVFTINKQHISQNNYKKWLDKSTHNVKFAELDNHYIIDSSLDKHENKLKELLDNKNNISNISIDNLSVHYHVTSKTFLDVSGKEIGKIYVLSDLSTEYSFLMQMITKMSIITLVLLVFLAFYYFRLLKKESFIITENETDIMSLAITDSLTTLYNKRHFDTNLPIKIQEAQNNDNYISFIIADIDNFKNYNDNYGHKKGDDVLKEVALQIKNSFKRVNDICYRIGGEEFAVIIETEKKNLAYKMSEKMRKNVANMNLKHSFNENHNRVTISIGIFTINSKDIVDYDSLFINADKALYRAKANGKNCTVSN